MVSHRGSKHVSEAAAQPPLAWPGLAAWWHRCLPATADSLWAVAPSTWQSRPPHSPAPAIAPLEQGPPAAGQSLEISSCLHAKTRCALQVWTCGIKVAGNFTCSTSRALYDI